MIEKYIFPPVSLYTKGVKAALNNGLTLISDDQNYMPNIEQDFIEVLDQFYVSKNLLHIITLEYLNTNIIGKYVYTCHNALYIGLPCNKIPYLLFDSDHAHYRDSNRAYYRIVFDTEQTIADLYRNAWKYKFDTTTMQYIKLDEHSAVQQLIKPLLARQMFRYFGYPSDRLADYGRIILFLLSKANLTDYEKEKLKPLEGLLPTIDDLSNVISREATLQAMIKKNKSDPIAFVNRLM